MGAAITPAVAAWVSIASAAAAAGASAVQSASAARFRSRIATRNSVIAKQRAADAFAVGAAEESRLNLRVIRMLGSQRASIGASGAIVDEGAALSVLEDTAMIGELDTLQIRNNAARAAYGLEVQSQNFLFDASAGRHQGRNALVGGAINTAASVFSSFSTFQSAGSFG